MEFTPNTAMTIFSAKAIGPVTDQNSNLMRQLFPYITLE
jgi:hypothetical protein